MQPSPLAHCLGEYLESSICTWHAVLKIVIVEIRIITRCLVLKRSYSNIVERRMTARSKTQSAEVTPIQSNRRQAPNNTKTPGRTWELIRTN